MKTLSYACIVAVTVLSGCATRPVEPPHGSAVNLSSYRAIAVDGVSLTPDAAARLTQPERRKLERALHMALVDGLPESARAVSRAPAVLRVAITVTALDHSSVATNAITTTLMHLPLDRGGVTFEVRYYDAPDSEPLALTTHQLKGKRLDYKGGFTRYGQAVNVMREFGSDIGGALGRS